MSELSTRIKKLAALPLTFKALDAQFGDFEDGVEYENARLTPLLEALAECVELFPTFHDTCEDGFYSCPAAENAFPDQRGSCNCGADARIKALTALESALKRLESRGER